MLALCMHCLGCTLGTESLMTDSVHLTELGVERTGPAAAHGSADSLAFIREGYFEQSSRGE